MSKQRLLSAASMGGLALLVCGGAFFQFYALGDYGDVDAVAAAGAGMLGLGGALLIATRAARKA